MAILRDSSTGLWKDLLCRKYRLERNGWRVGRSTSRVSGFCQGVSSVISDSGCHIMYRVYSRVDILFWLDKWIGDVPLAQTSSALFNIYANKHALVRDCYDIVHNKVVWGGQNFVESWKIGWWRMAISNAFIGECLCDGSRAGSSDLGS